MLRTSRDGNCSVSRSRIGDCSLYLLDNFLNEMGSNCVYESDTDSFLRTGYLLKIVLSFYNYYSRHVSAFNICVFVCVTISYLNS